MIRKLYLTTYLIMLILFIIIIVITINFVKLIIFRLGTKSKSPIFGRI